MNESHLYEWGVGVTAVGSLILGAAGFIYQLWLAKSPDTAPESDARGAFNDARIIVCLSLVPQSCLLVLPLLYKSPRDVPASLGPAAIFVSSMILCVWGWLLSKVVKAGYRRAWYSPRNLLIFSLPGLLTAVGIFIFSVLLGRR